MQYIYLFTSPFVCHFIIFSLYSSKTTNLPIRTLSFVLGQQDHEVKALYSQTAEKEGRIEMQVGDLVGIAGNEKDGTSKGKNRRTSAYGEYLSYKVEEVPVIAKFSTYNSDL